MMVNSNSKWIVSVLAVFLGVAVNFLAAPIDQFFHILHVFPPWGEPMRDVSENLLAFSYRALLAVAGGYVTARFAPGQPMRHAMILGAIGLVLTSAGAYYAMSHRETGPLWYPVLLAALCLPASYLGARIFMARNVGGWPR